jgi:hypothetical protein
MSNCDPAPAATLLHLIAEFGAASQDVGTFGDDPVRYEPAAQRHARLWEEIERRIGVLAEARDELAGLCNALGTDLHDCAHQVSAMLREAMG